MDDVKKLPDEEVPKRLGSKPAGASAPALPVIATHEEYELSYIVVGGHCVSSWTNSFLDASIVLLAVYFIFVWKSSRVSANPSPRFLRSMPCLLMSGLLKVTMASTVLTLAISDGQGPGTIQKWLGSILWNCAFWKRSDFGNLGLFTAKPLI